MNLEIATYDFNLIKDLFGKEVVSSGDEVQLAGEIKLKYETNYIRKGAGFPPLEILVLEFAIGVAGNLVANAIWDFFKPKQKEIESISIDGALIEYEEEKVKREIRLKVEKQTVRYVDK